MLGPGAINVDETGWFLAAENRAMWTATNQSAAIFRIACDRHQDRPGELFGDDCDGIVTSDRCRAYALLDPEQRQACLAMTGRIFGVWHAFTEQQERRRLQREMKPIEAQRASFLEHAANGSKRHRLHFRFAKNLLKIWPALWTFVTVDGVAPTNNAAERALRGPVIHRRLRRRANPTTANRFTERSLGASATCRLQRRSLYHYLQQLFGAHQRGGVLPP